MTVITQKVRVRQMAARLLVPLPSGQISGKILLRDELNIKKREYYVKKKLHKIWGILLICSNANNARSFNR
jgi:hypothetical protein